MRKNCQKKGVEKAAQKTCENHCRRRATPPHPRDTGHLKQGDGKREIGRLPRHRRRIICCWCGRGVPIAWFWKPKRLKYHQNGFQNLWNIEVAARLRFWIVYWAPKARRQHSFPDHSGSHFRRKSEKRHQKRHAKIDVEKVSKINVKSDQKWYQNGYQNRQSFKLFWKRLKCSKLFVLQ